MYKSTAFVAFLFSCTQITFAMKVDRIQLSPEIYHDIQQKFGELLQQKKSKSSLALQTTLNSPKTELITPQEFERKKKPRAISNRRILCKSPNQQNAKQRKAEIENTKKLLQLLEQAQKKDEERNIQVLAHLIKELEKRTQSLGK